MFNSPYFIWVGGEDKFALRQFFFYTAQYGKRDLPAITLSLNLIYLQSFFLKI